MIKIKKIDYNSPVVLSFALLCCIALLLNFITGGLANRYLFSVYRFSFTDILGYFRMFLYVLGHGSFSHLFNNLLLILLIGPILEEKYGSKNLLIMIIFTALISGLINIIVFPHVALMGASGIAFMFIVLVSYVNVRKDTIPLTFILIIILYLSSEIYNSIFVSDNISQITHIVGGLLGGIFGFYLNKEK